MIRLKKFYIAHCRSSLKGEFDLEANSKKELNDMIRDRVIKNFERIFFSVEECIEYSPENQL